MAQGRGAHQPRSRSGSDRRAHRGREHRFDARGVLPHAGARRGRTDRLDLEVDSYRHVVWLDEEDGEAWFQLAASEARLGRFGAADTAMANATELDPLRPGLFFLQGWIAEGLGPPRRGDPGLPPASRHPSRRPVHAPAPDPAARPAEALQGGPGGGAHAGRRTPGDLEARELEAELSFEAGETAEGMHLLDQMREDFPNSMDALSARLGVLARHGRGRAAVTEADRWVAAHPDDVRARLIAARAREMAGDLPAAIDQLRLAVAAAPDSLVPRVLLAQAYDRAGRPRDAEPVWAESQRRFPGLSSVSLDLALCREKLGNLEGAEVAVRDVLAHEPDNPVALNFLGYLFADHDRNLDEAVRLILKALALGRTTPPSSTRWDGPISALGKLPGRGRTWSGPFASPAGIRSSTSTSATSTGTCSSRTWLATSTKRACRTTSPTSESARSCPVFVRKREPLPKPRGKKAGCRLWSSIKIQRRFPSSGSRTRT